MTTMTPGRRALLIGWLVFGAALLFMNIAMAADPLFAASMLALLGGIAAAAYLIVSLPPSQAAQERAFLETYGSVEAARATLDVEALRELREREGLIPAVRLVRTQHPAIPLARAAEIVKSL